ncbi:hypothetical protein ABZ770_40805 [Streptomyces sp. NPDC006654]
MLHTTANLHGHTLTVPQTVAIEHLAHRHFEAQQLTGRSMGTDRSLFLGLIKDGIPALLKRWGTKVTASAQDLDLLVRSESVVQQVRAVITGPARPFAPDFPVPGTGLLAFDGRLGRPLAYQVDDRLWAPSRIRWRAHAEEHTCSGSSFIMTRVLLEVSVEPMLVLGVTVLDVSPAEPPAARERYET